MRNLQIITYSVESSDSPVGTSQYSCRLWCSAVGEQCLTMRRIVLLSSPASSYI